MKILKKWYFIILLPILIYLINITVYSTKKTDTNNSITITINKVTSGGYGYIISNNNKVLIKQKYIPAIHGKKVFCSTNDAKVVANLVRHKIITKKKPTVSLKELKDLNININCVDLH